MFGLSRRFSNLKKFPPSSSGGRSPTDANFEAANKDRLSDLYSVADQPAVRLALAYEAKRVILSRILH